MFLLPLLLAAGADPAPALSVVPDRAVSDEIQDPIVVTAANLKESAATLADCLARHCPPKQEIAAYMAHAENQFLAGDIEATRKTLLSARSRNKRYAEALPQDVSELLQFDADVASLLGLSDYSRIATFDSASALKAGLPVDDPRTLAKRLDVGDVFLRQGRYRVAVHMYDAVARRAEQGGMIDLRGAAMFRALRFYATAASVDPGFRRESGRRYADLASTTVPELQKWRDAALILEARLEILANKKADVDAVMERLRGLRSTDAILIYAPKINSPSFREEWVTPTVFHEQRVDLDYRITPSGTVADIDIASQSSAADPAWIAAMQKFLGERRYLPLALAPDAMGLRKRERFMIVADMSTSSGSRMRLKSGPPQVSTVDLSPKARIP